MIYSYLNKNHNNVIALFHYSELLINFAIEMTVYKQKIEYIILSVLICFIYMYHMVYIFKLYKQTCYDFIIYIFLGINKYGILLYFFLPKLYYISLFYIIELLLHILYGYILLQKLKKNQVIITLDSTNTQSLLSISNCSICLENINDDYYITECLHEFHQKCIIDWIKQIDNINNIQVCPYCRSDLVYSVDF